MFSYPLLTASEQASLPALIAEPKSIQARFEDSTHQLFACQTTKGAMVLKVCNQKSIDQSYFWSGANHLFAAEFPASLGEIHLTHAFLEKNGTLKIPEFISAGAQRFVMTRFLTGKDVETDHINEQWVIALAAHIAKLHQSTYANWGTLNKPVLPAEAWAGRLHDTLVFLAKKQGMSLTEPTLTEALAHANTINETEFVPMMLDLRWDQFRCAEDNSLALIDLDAFVIAPRALDLLLLEYVFTPAQLAIFKQRYTQNHRWPAHTKETACYQLLLFLMHVLGETNLAKWMQQF